MFNTFNALGMGNLKRVKTYSLNNINLVGSGYRNLNFNLPFSVDYNRTLVESNHGNGFYSLFYPNSSTSASIGLISNTQINVISIVDASGGFVPGNYNILQFWEFSPPFKVQRGTIAITTTAGIGSTTFEINSPVNVNKSIAICSWWGYRHMNIAGSAVLAYNIMLDIIEPKKIRATYIGTATPGLVCPFHWQVISW